MNFSPTDMTWYFGIIFRKSDIQANFQDIFFQTDDNSRVLQYFVHQIPVYYGLHKLPDAPGCTDKGQGGGQ